MKCIFIVALVLCAPMLAIGCGCGGSSSKDNDTKTESKASVWTCSMHPKVQAALAGACPTCGMDLIPKVAEVSCEKDGAKTAEGSCGKDGAKTAKVSCCGEAVEQSWTCSMHPDIKLPESGKCPLCKMALVQDTAGEPCKAEATATATVEATATATAEATAEATAQTTCPIMNKPIKNDLYVDHDGKRIYLCCKRCVRRCKKDPGKYITKLEDEGITLEAVPTSGE